MVQTAENWNSNDASISLQRIIGFTRRRIGNTVDTLMGTGMIEIVTVLGTRAPAVAGVAHRE